MHILTYMYKYIHIHVCVKDRERDDFKLLQTLFKDKTQSDKTLKMSGKFHRY